jgi:hypothetical protein
MVPDPRRGDSGYARPRGATTAAEDIPASDAAGSLQTIRLCFLCLRGGTANGEIYDVNAVTAAHPTLQLPNVVRVTNLENPQSAAAGQRPGLFIQNWLIDLSQAAARGLGFEQQGLTRMHVKYLGMAPLDEPPLRPGEARIYVALDCELPEPERLTC